MSGRLTPILFCGIAVVAGTATHQVQLRVDVLRQGEEGRRDPTFVPAPAAVKIAVMDFDSPMADLMWVRTVLSFADILDDHNAGVAGRETRWLRAMLETCATLDPIWRSVYFYGGSMMRVVDDVEGSDLLYTQGMERLPDDPYFAFSLGMNAYLYHHDPAAAFQYLDRASRLPGAPEWYRVAAAGFLDEHGQRRAAARYLEEQIELATEEREKQTLEAKLRMVLHDELAEQLEEARARFRERSGRDISRPDELGALPPDPEGGEWIIAPDGALRSSARDERLRLDAQRAERLMLTRPPPDAAP